MCLGHSLTEFHKISVILGMKRLDQADLKTEPGSFDPKIESAATLKVNADASYFVR
jgi:hypothetical protein